MTTRGQSTRKERREQARQERLAREEAERARQQRTRRMWQLGAALALAVVIVVVAVVISSSSGGGPTGLQKGKQANQTTSLVNSSLGGLQQSGNTLGPPNAPITMQYFGDLQCPICKDFTIAVLPQVIQNYVRTGRMKIQYRSLKTATPDTTTFLTQQVAALAAGKQNKMWQYVELFYNEQGQEGSGYVTESFLSGIASQVGGLNLSQWRSDRNDSSLTNEVSSDVNTAQQSGYTATPTLVITGPHGTKAVQGLAPYSTLASYIKAVS